MTQHGPRVMKASKPEPCDWPFPPPESFSDASEAITHSHEDGRVCVAQADFTEWATVNVPKDIDPETFPPDPVIDQKERGRYNKFVVHRADGRDRPGGDREGADYLVLDLTFDPAARHAAAMYAEMVKHLGYEKFCAELRAQLADLFMAAMKACDENDIEYGQRLLAFWDYDESDLGHDEHEEIRARIREIAGVKSLDSALVPHV